MNTHVFFRPHRTTVAASLKEEFKIDATRARVVDLVLSRSDLPDFEIQSIDDILIERLPKPMVKDWTDEWVIKAPHPAGRTVVLGYINGSVQ